MYRNLDDTRFNLIAIGQTLPAEMALGLGGLLSNYEIPSDSINEAELARQHLPLPSFYLLRPDGHVGLCGTRIEPATIKRYVSENLHLLV
jgi:hypothetical protein